MNIGILVHSLTGNTLLVAQKLSDKLKTQGHKANIVRLAPIGGDSTKMTDQTKIRLEPLPALDAFDFIVFAGPVNGFSMSAVMSKCFSTVPTLRGKRVACFVTQAFSRPFLGGNRTISQYVHKCEALGAKVCATGIVNWRNKQRDKMIQDVVETISAAI